MRRQRPPRSQSRAPATRAEQSQCGTSRRKAPAFAGDDQHKAAPRACDDAKKRFQPSCGPRSNVRPCRSRRPSISVRPRATRLRVRRSILASGGGDFGGRGGSRAARCGERCFALARRIFDRLDGCRFRPELSQGLDRLRYFVPQRAVVRSKSPRPAFPAHGFGRFTGQRDVRDTRGIQRAGHQHVERPVMPKPAGDGAGLDAGAEIDVGARRADDRADRCPAQASGGGTAPARLRFSAVVRRRSRMACHTRGSRDRRRWSGRA